MMADKLSAFQSKKKGSRTRAKLLKNLRLNHLFMRLYSLFDF